MKIVFKYGLILSLAMLGLLLSGGEARADSTYFTKRSILTHFFPSSDKVSFKTFTPTKAQRKVLQHKLGYALAKPIYHFFIATTKTSAGTIVDGYALIDDVMGQHRPITFAVKLSKEGVVLRQEVMVYREAHGEEVRDQRFAKQFRGKTVNDTLRVNRDIDGISGATISSRAITLGVRRALVLFQAAIPLSQSIHLSP